MKKFQFRLQKVMEIKEQVEKQRMMELAEAKKQVMDEQAKLKQIHQKSRDCTLKIETMKTGEINPAAMKHYYNYLDKLKMDADAQVLHIRQAENMMEKKRRVLLTATQERKALEKLKERKKEDYKVDLGRKEQNFLDDVSSMKVAREKQNEGSGEQ